MLSGIISPNVKRPSSEVTAISARPSLTQPALVLSPLSKVTGSSQALHLVAPTVAKAQHTSVLDDCESSGAIFLHRIEEVDVAATTEKRSTQNPQDHFCTQVYRLFCLETVNRTVGIIKRVMATPTLSARQRLIQAADRLFYREGIHATGIDRLVEAAEVAKMTLYNNFSSKDELVAAWLTWRHENWEQRLASRLDRAESATDQILAVFDAYLDPATEPGQRGCAFLNAAAEIPSAEHPARAVILSHKHGVREFLVEQAKESGADKPDELGEQLFVLLEGGIVAAGVRGDPDPIRAARSAAETLLNAT